MIEIKHLHHRFGKKVILEDVSLTVERNEVCALVGRNGAGKSTLIQCLLGMLPVKQGEIWIDGKRPREKRKEQLIAYLPEKFMLYPQLSGYDNMLFFARATSSIIDEERIQSLLTSVQLWDVRNQVIQGYSKGMLQRLGLAITLYQNAPILVLDEPTSGLDPMGRAEILQILRGLQGKTILLSSHHLDEIQQLCTHVAFLEHGRIEKYTVAEFLHVHNWLGVSAI